MDDEYPINNNDPERRRQLNLRQQRSLDQFDQFAMSNRNQETGEVADDNFPSNPYSEENETAATSISAAKIDAAASATSAAVLSSNVGSTSNTVGTVSPTSASEVATSTTAPASIRSKKKKSNKESNDAMMMMTSTPAMNAEEITISTETTSSVATTVDTADSDTLTVSTTSKPTTRLRSSSPPTTASTIIVASASSSEPVKLVAKSVKSAKTAKATKVTTLTDTESTPGIVEAMSTPLYDTMSVPRFEFMTTEVMASNDGMLPIFTATASTESSTSEEPVGSFYSCSERDEIDTSDTTQLTITYDYDLYTSSEPDSLTLISFENRIAQGLARQTVLIHCGDGGGGEPTRLLRRRSLNQGMVVALDSAPLDENLADKYECEQDPYADDLDAPTASFCTPFRGYMAVYLPTSSSSTDDSATAAATETLLLTLIENGMQSNSYTNEHVLKASYLGMREEKEKTNDDDASSRGGTYISNPLLQETSTTGRSSPFDIFSASGLPFPVVVSLLAILAVALIVFPIVYIRNDRKKKRDNNREKVQYYFSDGPPTKEELKRNKVQIQSAIEHVAQDDHVAARDHSQDLRRQSSSSRRRRRRAHSDDDASSDASPDYYSDDDDMSLAESFNSYFESTLGPLIMGDEETPEQKGGNKSGNDSGNNNQRGGTSKSSARRKRSRSLSLPRRKKAATLHVNMKSELRGNSLKLGTEFKGKGFDDLSDGLGSLSEKIWG